MGRITRRATCSCAERRRVMRRLSKCFVLVTIGTLLALPVAAQESRQERAVPGVEGPIEFGFRTFWGDVYGRPDLPFKPDLATSKLSEYSDIRNNFYVRRADITLDDILGTRNYVKYQTQSSFYRDQSHLATFGQYGKFKAQFRYDEIPHIYTN